MANYSFKTPPDVANGTTIEGWNLVRGTPHTAIYTGKTGLTFRKCNLTNCDLPGDAVVEDCLHVQNSFCSHNNPKWLAKGYISECATECTHLVSTDTVTIDGVVVSTVYHYEDKVVA